MNTRKSSRKKNNRYDIPDEAVDESKTPEVIDSSSVTIDTDTKEPVNNDPDLKTAFMTFQNKTEAQFCNMGYSFHQLTESISALHDLIAELHSRQKAPSQDDDANSDSSTDDHTDPEPDYNDVSTPHANHPTYNHTPPTVPMVSHNVPQGFATPKSSVPPTHFPTVHKFWKVVRDENLEPHRFLSLVKDTILQDDSKHGIRQFYNKLRHAMHTSFKKHVDILPPFGKLATISNITQLLVPSNPNYIGYTTIRSVYEWFSSSILNLLNDTNVIDKKRTPRAYHVIITHNHIDDGWDLLFVLLSKLCPFLGGKTMDVASEITLLRLQDNETIHSFFRRVQHIQTKIQFSRESIDKTRITRFYLKAMSVSKQHFPLLQNFIADLNHHITTYGPNVAHPTMTCSTIYDYLVSIEAPETFQTQPHIHNNNKYKSFHKNKNKYETASKTMTPNISALAQLQELLNTNDIPYDSESSDNIEMETIDDDDDSDIPSKYIPIIAAFKRSNNIICDACGSRGHHASKCYKRGLKFLPQDIQRRITAYNAKHGESPKHDSSTDPHKSYRALEPPDHRPNQGNHQESDTINDDSQDHVPTISSINHDISPKHIEEILDIELGNQTKATIKMMKSGNIQKSTHVQSTLNQSDTLIHKPLITRNGTVDVRAIHDMQTNILDSYPIQTMRTYRSAVFHVDSGANVHATNDINDFVIFYPIKSDITLAVGSTPEMKWE